MALASAEDLKPADPTQRELEPSAEHYYPVDPATLPPGVDPAQIVTVVQTIDGDVVGGVTYRVVERV